MGGKPATTGAAKDVADAVVAQPAAEGAQPASNEVGQFSADHDLDPSDPAVTGVPRDERTDSIDPHTGALTDEAQQLRREQAVTE